MRTRRCTKLDFCPTYCGACVCGSFCVPFPLSLPSLCMSPLSNLCMQAPAMISEPSSPSTAPAMAPQDTPGKLSAPVSQTPVSMPESRPGSLQEASKKDGSRFKFAGHGPCRDDNQEEPKRYECKESTVEKASCMHAQTSTWACTPAEIAAHLSRKDISLVWATPHPRRKLMHAGKEHLSSSMCGSQLLRVASL